MQDLPKSHEHQTSNCRAVDLSDHKYNTPLGWGLLNLDVGHLISVDESTPEICHGYPKSKTNERGTLSSKPPFYILNTVSLISGVYVEKWQTLKDPPSGDYIYHSTWNRWTKGVFVPWKQESSRSSKVLMWHDLTCCFILFGLVHNIQIWTFNFHHGTILGKHSNHFRTPRTSKVGDTPHPVTATNRITTFLVRESWVYTTTKMTWMKHHRKRESWYRKKTFISDKRLHPALPSRPCHKRKLIFQPYWWKKSQTNP